MTPPTLPCGLFMDNIVHDFARHPVLKGISLAVEAGKLTCLLGPSGCGKTTLLRLAAGLEPIQHGRVTIDGRVVSDGESGCDLAPEKRGVGLMFQDYALFPHLNIFDNIAFGLPSKTRNSHRAWIAQSLTKMGLSRYADAYPHMLSGGQQQRVALLRALAPRPGVLLLDEPFSGLDITRRAQVREETLNLLKTTGVATLMVTHDPEEAMFMGDHIVVMNDGLAVQGGTPAQIYFSPNDAFVAALFGPINRFTAAVRDGIITTPLGSISAERLENGRRVEVLIRPEGIKIDAPGLSSDGAVGNAGSTPAPTHPARVISAHLLGRSTHLHLSLTDIEGRDVPIQARVNGVFMPEEGAMLALCADLRQTFVFPLPPPR